LHFGNTGAWGEAMAERAVRKARCQILARNWRSRRLEADIVALERRTLIVVEVKTRHERSMRDFPAHEAVTPEKQHHLDLLALAFKRSNGPLCRRLGVKGARLDTIEVYYRRTILKRHRVVAIMWHRG
jgi:putative endonuclease